jgi:hypothetical protein
MDFDQEFVSIGNLLKKHQIDFDLPRYIIDLLRLMIVLIKIVKNRRTTPKTPLIAKKTTDHA